MFNPYDKETIKRELRHVEQVYSGLPKKELLTVIAKLNIKIQWLEARTVDDYIKDLISQ